MKSEIPNRPARKGPRTGAGRPAAGGRPPEPANSAKGPRRTKANRPSKAAGKPGKGKAGKPYRPEERVPFRPVAALKWTVLCFLAALILFSAGTMLQAHAAKNVKWENPYVDVTQNMWSYQYITELNRLGVFPNADNFEPGLSESRGDLALCLYRMDDTVFAENKALREKEKKENKTPDPAPPTFADVDPESELYEAVCWVFNSGIMQGPSETEFAPGLELTREQVCTIISRFASFEQVPLIQVVQPNQFKDSLDVSQYARSGVTACQMAGVVSGDDADCFNPQNPMTRQEMAAVLYRIMTAAQAEVPEGVPLVDLSPGAYDALYESYTRPGTYTQALIPAREEPVTMLYWDKAVFIGDSVSVMLESYCSSTHALGGAKFLCASSMSATSILSGKLLPEWPNGSGQHPSIQDSVAETGAEVVYIMLGMNNMSRYVDGAIRDLVTVCSNLQAANPDITIIVESVTPMTEDSPRKDSYLNNDVINGYNQKMQDICQEHQWYFLNVAEVFKDENGNLIPQYCSDPTKMGMHFTYEGTKVWVDYLKTHVPQELLEKLELV